MRDANLDDEKARQFLFGSKGEILFSDDDDSEQLVNSSEGDLSANQFVRVKNENL